ncbi:hypothetical protein I6F35_25580 [Bradyrhizobium sp. BRP22]|nr:hypothetical protein [Bradyrhizobium sp. BRP22]
MVQPCSLAGRDQVVDTMIALTHLSNLHRTIIAGSGSMELYLSLRRRGFVQVATSATCRVPRRQHGIGLLTGDKSLPAIEAALLEISQFLSANATIAILIDSREGEFCLSIRRKLEQMGFRIEAGVRCQRGLVLAAHRQGFARMERAA